MIVSQMQMAEDGVIDVGMSGFVVACIVDQKAERIDRGGLGMREAGFVAPPLAEAHSQIGMYQPRKDRAQSLRAEAAVHQAQHRLVAYIHIVAVGYEQLFIGERKTTWCKLYLHTAFALQVVVAPHVVISCKKYDLYAAIGQLREFA